MVIFISKIITYGDFLEFNSSSIGNNELLFLKGSSGIFSPLISEYSFVLEFLKIK